ncbi:sodium:proton exchanger [bacterium]|nr:sodium:proton exchanger [bacterium]
MGSGILELAIIFVLAAILGVGAKLLKQPLILVYLVAGVIVSYFNLFDIVEKGLFETFSSLGVMLLLFLIGLEINYTTVRTVGRVSLILGLAQIAFTSLFGFLIAMLFDFGILPSFYIAIALTFSSTIIILKLLSEKRDEHSLYGRISIGFLLVQDFVAILLLTFLTGLDGKEGFAIGSIVITMIQGILLFSAMLFIGQKILPKLFDMIAGSRELLFLVSLAWAFLMVALVEQLGFSIEMGGFLAGLALANSSENFQISGMVRPLRDFFILIFFVMLGSSIAFSGLGGVGLPVIIFSLFVLIGNPLIVLILMGLMGYRKRTSFLTGLTVAQISEFSLVLIALGFRLGHLSQDVVVLVTAVGVVTITTSTYLIVYADKVFAYLSSLLSLFERKKLQEQDLPGDVLKSIILIGCHRTGQSIAFNLPKKNLLVIDFDPEVIQSLKKHKFDHVFGDIGDPDVFDRINFKEAKLVISTSPHFDDNVMLLSLLVKFRPRPRVVLRAEDEREARILYRKGADYVLLPHFTAGQYLGKTISIDPNMRVLDQLRERDKFVLKKVSSII